MKTNTTQKIRVSNRESVKIYLRKTRPTTVQLELWAHHTVTVSLSTLWEGSKRFSTSFFQEFRIIRECNGSISGSAPIELYLALRILRVTKRATARYETSCVRQQRNLQTVVTFDMTKEKKRSQLLTDATRSLRVLLSNKTNANEPANSPITWSAE